MKRLSLTDMSMCGLNLIEASAGTGKTWTIAALYLRLLLERALRPEQILVVTYTRAATAELKERIRRRISDTLELFSSNRAPADELEQVLLQRCADQAQAQRLLTRALFCFDDAAIFTIHGFCQRALNDHAFESASLFDTDMVTDQSSLVHEVVDDYWRRHILTQSPEFLDQITADRLTPDALLSPLQRHLQTPGLRILPDMLHNDFQQASQARSEQYRQAIALWREHSEEILALLQQPGLMHQGSYKPQQIQKAAAKLEEWLASGNPALPCDGIDYFSCTTLVKKVTKGKSAPQHPFFQVCHDLQHSCQAADTAYSSCLINHRIALHQWVSRELPARKRRENQRCYDDLLLNLEQALCSRHGQQLATLLRERYHASLIDEFQDTDPLQWRIFQQLSNHDDYPLFLIGDPKQAIYSFRGADIHAYLAAAGGVGAEQRWTLDTNRRSVQPLVHAVNTLFGTCPAPFMTSGIDFHPVRSGRPADDQLILDEEQNLAPLQIWIHPHDETGCSSKEKTYSPISQAVSAEISRLLDSGCRIQTSNGPSPLRPDDIAVLVRTHRQGQMIHSALTRQGIPAVHQGNQSVFETWEARDLLQIMRCVAEPGRESLIRLAMVGGFVGMTAPQLDALLLDEPQWEIWLHRFRGMVNAFQTSAMIGLSSWLLDECGVRRHLLALPDGERRMTNLLHCVELVHQAALENRYAIEGCCSWLEERIAAGHSDENSLLRLETDAHAVTIATIHASKGLQYPVVFIPFAWDVSTKAPDTTLFHATDGTLTLDLGSDRHPQHSELTRAEQRAEAARLLYVALTRAEFRCYLVWGRINGAADSPLHPLLHGTHPTPLAHCSDQEIIDHITTLDSTAAGIRTCHLPSDIPARVANCATGISHAPLASRTFSGTIRNDWRISSFSSLTGSATRPLQPRDMDNLPASSLPDEPTPAGDGNNIGDFPRGADAGTCLHELLENLDFSNLQPESLVRDTTNCLQRNGFSPVWTPAITTMVQQLSRVPLLSDDPSFCLAHLSPGSWLTEMEFFLPVKQISASVLQTLFRGMLSTERHATFSDLLATLQIQQSRGMLLGFIDMVFVHDNRYYLIDWKSNHLGYDPQFYETKHLAACMAQHHYILQYHLYTLALDRLLAQRLPDYDYDTHFGGALYLFLRGISSQTPHQGVYRDRPGREFIQRAQDILLE